MSDEEEIKFYREKLKAIEDSRPKTKENLYWLLRNIQVGSDEPKGIPEDCIEALIESLYPIIHPVEIDGRAVVINIPMAGELKSEVLQRYYAYSDFLKNMGAKNVIFLAKGASLMALSDEDLKAIGLRRIENANSESNI